MTRATQIALVALAAVAVAVLFGFVRHVEAKDSHASGCANYRDALTLALNDPMSSAPITGLSTEDRGTVSSSRIDYQSTYTSVGPDNPIVGKTDRAKLARGWQTFAQSFEQQALARRHC